MQPLEDDLVLIASREGWERGMLRYFALQWRLQASVVSSSHSDLQVQFPNADAVDLMLRAFDGRAKQLKLVSRHGNRK